MGVGGREREEGEDEEEIHCWYVVGLVTGTGRLNALWVSVGSRWLERRSRDQTGT